MRQEVVAAVLAIEINKAKLRIPKKKCMFSNRTGHGRIPDKETRKNCASLLVRLVTSVRDQDILPIRVQPRRRWLRAMLWPQHRRRTSPSPISVL